MQSAANRRSFGLLLGRYLLKEDPTDELVERYAAADAARFGNSAPDALILFVQRNPWSLPYLDAAAALLRRDSALRGKIAIMLAIVETTPRHTALFLPTATSIPRTALYLCWQGLLAGGACIVGALIYPIAARTK